MAKRSHIYYFLQRVAQLILRLFIKLDVSGVGNIPSEGGLLLLSNHISYIDPVLIGSFNPRRMHFMAKSSAFEVPVLGRFLLLVFAFPVDRDSADVRALRRAVSLLKKGEVVGIFPSGGIVRDGRKTDAKEGVSFIAQSSGALILPVYLEGTRDFYGFRWLIPRRVSMRLVFGNTFSVPVDDNEDKKTQRIAIGNLIMDRIFELATTSQDNSG